MNIVRYFLQALGPIGDLFLRDIHAMCASGQIETGTRVTVREPLRNHAPGTPGFGEGERK